MDPRHPELAKGRLKDLLKQYDTIEADMSRAVTSAKLGELEREGSLVIQEICLVAPRLHEAMMQTSRQRRYDLTHGVLDEPQDTLVEMPHDGYLSVDEVIEENPVEEPVVIEKLVETELDKEVNETLKPLEEPKKKTTRKKKTARKADK